MLLGVNDPIAVASIAPLIDPHGSYCRACATRIRSNPSGAIASHAPGGERVSLRSSRLHCVGSRKPGWNTDFPTCDPATARASGLVPITGLRTRFGLDPAAVRLLHMRDRFALPAAIVITTGGSHYAYDPALVAEQLGLAVTS